MKLCLVHWVDASNDSGWSTQEDALKLQPDPCITAGWLMVEDAQRVVVATTVAPDFEGDVGGTWVIPRTWVTRIDVLRD